LFECLGREDWLVFFWAQALVEGGIMEQLKSLGGCFLLGLLWVISVVGSCVVSKCEIRYVQYIKVRTI